MSAQQVRQFELVTNSEQKGAGAREEYLAIKSWAKGSIAVA
jgi:hypothetical protein